MHDDASLAYTTALTNNDNLEADKLGQILDTATVLDRIRSSQPDRIHAAAHHYADQGWPVFPIKPRGKQPLTAHGFKDATTDHATIQAWWAQWPDANLGLPTGVAFDVIDIDGPEGLATMYRGDQPLIDTVTVLGYCLTARDAGRHIYVPATGNPNKAALFPGVDYRGAGGYVVAPPSIGANGRRYEWVAQFNHARIAA